MTDNKVLNILIYVFFFFGYEFQTNLVKFNVGSFNNKSIPK